jgi:methylmalonyl-CoA carboxyltransferase large subunit
MNPEAANLARLIETVEALRGDLVRLSDRVAALEAAADGKPRAPAPLPPAEEIREEMILVISAAVAAYLGKRPHIRQVRLLRSDAWAQQGRVTIQASHRLAVPHG